MEATNKSMKMEDIRAAFMGKNIHYYSSWSGRGEDFVIGNVVQDSSGHFIYLCRKSKKGCAVHVNKADIPQLLETGRVEYRREIDHCTVIDTWTLA